MNPLNYHSNPCKLGFNPIGRAKENFFVSLTVRRGNGAQRGAPFPHHSFQLGDYLIDLFLL
jgi:hypothetical protein